MFINAEIQQMTLDNDEDTAAASRAAHSANSSPRGSLISSPRGSLTPNNSSYNQLLSATPSKNKQIERSNSTDLWLLRGIRSYFLASVTISFGTVAQCAIMSPLANVLDTFVLGKRKSENSYTLLFDRFGGFCWYCLSSTFNGGSINSSSKGSAGLNGFSKMSLESSSNENDNNYKNIFSRDFLLSSADYISTRWNELAMVYVAQYYKNFQSAAIEVNKNIEGISKILRQDCTSLLTSSFSTVISLAVTIAIGLLIELTRSASNIDNSAKGDNENDDNVDFFIFKHLFLCFCLAHAIIETVVEVDRAAIRAVYITFAEKPESLSQSFPIVFHRLCRLRDDDNF
jgi:hypothetical protein